MTRKLETALVIDDDDAFRTTLQGALRRRGVRARTAATVDEGLVALEYEPADLVIIDYRMPKLYGDESIAVDLHTHGRSRALWSLIDDRDDQGVKVAGVFGHLHHERPSAAFRLAVNGYYKSLRHPWEVARLSDDDLEPEPKPGWSILTWLRWTRGVTWNI